MDGCRSFPVMYNLKTHISHRSIFYQEWHSAQQSQWAWMYLPLTPWLCLTLRRVSESAQYYRRQNIALNSKYDGMCSGQHTPLNVSTVVETVGLWVSAMKTFRKLCQHRWRTLNPVYVIWRYSCFTLWPFHCRSLPVRRNGNGLMTTTYWRNIRRITPTRTYFTPNQSCFFPGSSPYVSGPVLDIILRSTPRLLSVILGSLLSSGMRNLLSTRSRKVFLFNTNRPSQVTWSTRCCILLYAHLTCKQSHFFPLTCRHFADDSPHSQCENILTWAICKCWQPELYLRIPYLNKCAGDHWSSTCNHNDGVRPCENRPLSDRMYLYTELFCFFLLSL